MLAGAKQFEILELYSAVEIYVFLTHVPHHGIAGWSVRPVSAAFIRKEARSYTVAVVGTAEPISWRGVRAFGMLRRRLCSCRRVRFSTTCFISRFVSCIAAPSLVVINRLGHVVLTSKLSEISKGHMASY